MSLWLLPQSDKLNQLHFMKIIVNKNTQEKVKIAAEQ